MEALDDDVSRVRLDEEPRISAVALKDVDWFWPRVRHWLVAALEESAQHEFTEEEVYKACLKGEFLLLALAFGNVLTGAAVLAASKDPKGTPYLGVICCGGEQAPRWISLLVDTCRLIGRDVGAREILMMGRPGWRPMLQAQGARLAAVVMRMDL